MKSNGFEESYAMEYAWHHHDSMTFTIYSDRHDPTNLRNNVLDKMHYKELDINKLKVNWKQKLKNPP